jgi:hypothetical protein
MHILLIRRGLRKCLQYMVGVAPISYRAPPSHPFCPLSGAWPHPVRPTAGVPSARGISDHPHPQHGHMPSPAYLPHPAFYSPIPHPGMLYPYMPHPYPPPSAPMPDSNSRKRAAPEETQPSRNKRKRSNGRDAVESEPHVSHSLVRAPPYTFFLSKQMDHGAAILQTSAIRLRRLPRKMVCYTLGYLRLVYDTDFGPCHRPSFSVIAQLQAYTPGSGPSTNDNRASTTDRERLMRSFRDSIIYLTYVSYRGG